MNKCVVVGVSFICLVETMEYDELENLLEEMAGEVGLTYAFDQCGFDQNVDVFVGVRFKDVPSAAQVEDATAKVLEKLPKVEQMMKATADSGVASWIAVGFS